MKKHTIDSSIIEENQTEPPTKELLNINTAFDIASNDSQYSLESTISSTTSNNDDDLNTNQLVSEEINLEHAASNEIVNTKSRTVVSFRELQITGDKNQNLSIVITDDSNEISQSDIENLPTNVSTSPGINPINSKLSSLTSMKIVDGDECEGPNTIIQKNSCVCLDGYSYGDPNTKNGCWKCNNECHPSAICDYPGRCVCANGLIGDGLRSCSLPIPILISITPERITQTSFSDSVRASFSTSTGFSPIEAYCMIGKIVDSAVISGDNSLDCRVPPSASGLLRVSISFDNESWSEESIYLDIDRDEKEKKFEIVWPVWVILIIAFVGAIGYKTCTNVRETEKEENPDERKVLKANRMDSTTIHNADEADPLSKSQLA